MWSKRNALQTNGDGPAAGLPQVEVARQPLQFARGATSFQQVRALVRQVDEARWGLEVHRTSQPRGSSIDFAHRLVDAIDHSGRLDGNS
jgi:hypothetical protein